MSREREWKLYFDDLFGFCEKVVSYTHGLTKEKFEASGLNYDATLWNVQLFGEAAKIFLKQYAPKCRKYPGAN